MQMKKATLACNALRSLTTSSLECILYLTQNLYDLGIYQALQISVILGNGYDMRCKSGSHDSWRAKLSAGSRLQTPADSQYRNNKRLFDFPLKLAVL